MHTHTHLSLCYWQPEHECVQWQQFLKWPRFQQSQWRDKKTWRKLLRLRRFQGGRKICNVRLISQRKSRRWHRHAVGNWIYVWVGNHVPCTLNLIEIPLCCSCSVYSLKWQLIRQRDRRDAWKCLKLFMPMCYLHWISFAAFVSRTLCVMHSLCHALFVSCTLFVCTLFVAWRQNRNGIHSVLDWNWKDAWPWFCFLGS